MTDALPTPDPLPPLRTLPPGYPRHDGSDTEVARAVAALVADVGWTVLSWSGLVAALAALGRTDIPLARLAEGHVDALRTADQVGVTLAPGALYGVWASRSLSTGLAARATAGGWRLDGTLRFASGTGVLDRALVPALIEDGPAVLVDLPVADLPADTSAWQTRAMAVSRSHVVRVEDRAVGHDAVVGPAGFYLQRPGFFPGGVGVAAVWAGGLCRVVDLVLGWLGARRWPAGDVRLGRLWTQRATALALVAQAGQRLDALLTPDARPLGSHPPELLQQVSTLARAGVAAAVLAGLDEVRGLAGPAGLAFDLDLTRAVDDLDLYVRQQNADADAAFLGSTLRPVPAA